MGAMTNQDLATWIRDTLKDGVNREWRKRAIESYDFHAGRQWSSDDTAKMEEAGRVPIVFNRIARTINAVSGLELQNRQEVRYIPRELSDSGLSEVFTNAAKWVRDGCDAEDEESEAFQDALKCGIGFTETRIDYESDPEGVIQIDRIDPLEMCWDKNASKRNLSDARWISRTRKLSKTEFEGLWPDKIPEYAGASESDDEDEPHDATEAKYYRENHNDNEQKKDIQVVQFQWWEREPYYQVETEQGNVVEFDTDKYKKIEKYLKEKGLKSVRRNRRVYKQAFLNGLNILEEGPAPCNHSFTFRAITGLRDRNKNSWFGIVDLMKDPQRYANKWLSQIMFILSTNSKGGLLAEEGAFKNARKAEEDWAKPDAIVWMNNGGLQRVKEKGQGEYPEGVDRLLQYAIESINDVPGINLETLGLANRDQASVLETQRKQSGLTMLSIFFDSLRRYRKEQGRVLAYFIQEYISDGRLIRVLGKETAQYVPLVKSKEAIQYDVVVDDAPSSPNMKERVFATLSQLIPSLLKSNIPIPPDVLDYSPLPESLVQKWKASMPDPNAEPPPDPKIEAEKAKLEIEKQRAHMQMQIEQAQAQQTAQIEKLKTDLYIQLETQKTLAQIELNRIKAQADIERNKEQSEFKMKNQSAETAN